MRLGQTLIIVSLILLVSLMGQSCSNGSRERTAAPEPRAEAPQTQAAVPEEQAGAAKAPEQLPLRLDSYTIKGLIFTYYQIPAGLDDDQLIATAQSLHEKEPKAHLILVDDRAQLAEYIHYAQEFSRGNTEAFYPEEWAERHIIANVQLYLSGRWVLCRSNGYEEIADLK